MKNFDFPIFKTKSEGVTKKFNLNDPDGRREYFSAKAGEEIAIIRKYLESGKAFVAYLLGKKNSGKGKYSKLFMEAIGGSRVGHVAVGDIVRDVHAGLSDPAKKKELSAFLGKHYRGFHSLEEIDGLIEGRNQSTLVSTELIIALLKYEVSKRPRQAIFIDGFPRGLDQVSYSIFLRELLGYHGEPDFFVFIDVPNTVIDERIKARVICPVCKTPRSLKLAPTRKIGYDEKQKAFYLICDNPACKGARMVSKEGDELGIEPIRARLEADEKIFRRLLELKGVPKVLLRNSLPADQAADFVDDYEVTPMYGYERDEKTGKIRVIEKPWTVDDHGVPSYSLLPAPVVISLIKQVAKILT